MTQSLRCVFLLEYDGSRFHGVQFQPNAFTVEQALWQTINALGLTIPNDKQIPFSGRTDAGVHALGQVFVLDILQEEVERFDNLPYAFNAHLPKGVRVVDMAIAEDPMFHPTINAQWRWYRYQVMHAPQQPVLMPPNAHWSPFAVDIELMNKACQLLLGPHNFKAFQQVTNLSAGQEPVHAECEMRWAACHQLPQSPIIAFDFVANRYVYRMVRNLVGHLLDIGRGKLSPETLSQRLLERDMTIKTIAQTAPAEGLTLMSVDYGAKYPFFQNHLYVKTLKQLIIPVSTVSK